jgi:parallel beta-helix repeat protein
MEVPMRQRHGSSLLVVVLGLLVSLAGSGVGTPAFAADCGGATPCSCGDTVVASRTLVCGVDPVTTTICTGIGLLVARALPADPPVDLNLGFCTIRGDGGDVGILIVDDDVIVRHGRITGFGAGVGNGMIGTDGSTLSGLNIYENATGIFLQASNTTIRNNLVRLNDATGIDVLGTENTVSSNHTEDNGAHGVVVAGVMNTVTGNVSKRNDRNGIEVLGLRMGPPPNNIVSSNRSESNGGQGVVVDGIMNTVTGNFSQRNVGDGFDINGRATVRQNRAKYNGLEGFKLQGSGHSVSLNEAHMNGTDGFTVFANMSRFDRNRSDYNGDFGILDATMGAGGNVYTGNRCTGNQDGPSAPAGLCQ